MKKIVLYLFLFHAVVGYCQQLPDYTQFRSGMVMLNPAVTGTKRLLDARLNYRSQWVGFDGSPETQYLNLNSRFMKGIMGAGLILYNDVTGPTRRLTYGLDYAVHIRFPDVELSFGVRGTMTNYSIDGSKITIHNSGDKAIDQSLLVSETKPNASAGLYFYNDRFHIGVSALNMIPSKHEYQYIPGDSLRKSVIKSTMHNYFSMGYNYSNSYDFIWQNTVIASYVYGVPASIGYNLTLRIQEKFLAGATVRLGSSLGLNVGFVLTNELEVHYSYDVIYSSLSNGNAGTHEAMIVYSFNYGNKRGRSEGFQHQKYRYLF